MKEKKIGFIGLGAMGSKIAERLMRSGGYKLGVFNRTSKKADEFVKRGAWLAKTPKELGERSDVIITVVTDDKAVRDVVEGENGVFAGARQGTIFIDCGTISVIATKELAKKAESLGFHWLDAPVLGSPKSAEDGEMPFVIGGSKEKLDEIKEILEVVGKKIIWMGEPGLGQAAKIVHNITCGISLMAYSEAILLGEKFGLTRKQTLDTLMNGAVNSTLLTMKAPKFEIDEFEPTNAPLVNIVKDLTLATDAAKLLNIKLPALLASKEAYDLAKENNFGHHDTSSVIKILRLD